MINEGKERHKYDKINPPFHEWWIDYFGHIFVFIGGNIYLL